MARDHSSNLEKSVLLRRSNPRIFRGSAKGSRSSSFKWFIPVIPKSCCCLTFFLISCFLNASGIILVRKLSFF